MNQQETTIQRTIAIVGLGLIGGSMALRLRKEGFAQHIIGVDASETHAQRAIDLHIADEIMNVSAALQKADLMILAIPVDAAAKLLPELLNQTHQQVIMDTGSTKQVLCEAVRNHPKRSRFLATHPIWGTEFSGPDAATLFSFDQKAAVISEQEFCNQEALQLVESLYQCLGMHLIYMQAAAHDLHAAYISHISHITSFALANTVLEKEKEEDAIFQLASGGFESTVRLAKSNPAMWVPIFRENRENVLDVLNEHISQLRKFKSCLEKENYDYLLELIAQANQIKKILR